MSRRVQSTVIAHITDAHISPNGKRTAVLKDRSVEILEDLVCQTIECGADLVLYGGDNIDNKDGEAELRAFMDIANRGPRWLCVTGNHESVHDLPGSGRISKRSFAAAVEGHGIAPGRYSFSETVNDVRVIGLDTTLYGTGGGHVSDETLDFLADELRHAEEDHIVVLGHHLLAAPWAPYRLDAWDKDYLVSNRDVVVSLLATNPRVRAYLCGHHHASRVHRIAGRGQGGGFYHILTPSPVAYPAAGRLLRFEEDGMVIETIHPRLEGVESQSLEAVMSGRKAQRYELLGTQRSFTEYVSGRDSDNFAVLPYSGPRTKGVYDSGLERRMSSVVE